MGTRRAISVVLLFFLFFTPTLAVTINPATQQLTNPEDKVYLFVYSIINDDPQPRVLSIKLDPFTTYLQDKISFSKERITLMPGKAENIQLSINPQGLGPETHDLKASIYDGAEKVGLIELLVAMPGTPIENYAITVDAKDTTSDTAVPVSVELANYGNIIGYAQLSLDIIQTGKVIGTVTYPDLVQVLPNTKVPYDLIYTDRLAPGFYTARVSAVYATKNTSAEKQFSVRLEETKEYIKEGSDIVLTFASLGNPSAVQYRLLDSGQKERAAGTFFPQTGDIVIPTSTLSAGDYDLYLSLQQGEQHIALVVQGDQQYGKYAVIFFVIGIISYALYSLRNTIAINYKLYSLRRTVRHRETIVINLINRSHRLVDEYSLYVRHQQANPGVGTPDKRP